MADKKKIEDVTNFLINIYYFSKMIYDLCNIEPGVTGESYP